MNARGTSLLLGGLGLGAGLMYLFDPDRGRRRRARVRDRAVGALHDLEQSAGKTARDLAHRGQGLLAHARAVFEPEQAVEPDVLEQRVRSEIGRVVSHPGSIDVTCYDGNVVLTGLILQEEIHPLLDAVRRVKGVKSTTDWLCEVPGAEHISALQGGVPRTGRRFELLQENWSPATRLLAGVAGGLLAAWGARRRDLTSLASATAGVALLARAWTNTDLRRLLGVGRYAAPIALQKTLRIDAPVADLFEFWRNPENYPRVFAHVREVKKVGENLYHWSVAGPAGSHVGWEGTITRLVPNELLEFRSVAGSLVENAGVVRLDPNYDGSTRLHIRMSYRPPAGLVGHWIAELFGADPKSALDDDLARLKSLFERGKTRAHGETVTRQQLQPQLKKAAAAGPMDLMAST
ncbi:MAG TPA: SRPBCC family protein [Terriglobales bacterium]|nr:SRPBCC family protein [Terriglobales bacterium]